MEIYHDSSDSWIVDNGTGGLKFGVAGTGTSGFYKGTGSETLATFEPDGAVTLYHNNSAKLATSSSGIDVTGNVSLTGDVTISNAGPTLYLTDTDNNPDWQIKNGNGNLRFIDATNSVDVLTATASGIDVTGNASFTSGNRDLDIILADSPSTGNAGVQLRAGASDYIGIAGGGGTGVGIVVDDSNNVGIGTSSPAHKIHIASGSTNVGIQTISTDAGAYMGFEDNSTGNTGSNSNVYVGANGDNFLVFTGASERARFNSTGLGIGTTSPYDKVEVSGAIAASGSTNANTSQGHVTSIDVASSRSRINAVDWGHEFKPFDIRASEITFGASSGSATEVARITSTGLGIGTTSPDFELDVAGNIGMDGKLYHNGDHNTYIGFDSDEIQLRTGGTDRVVINSSGNVGIGDSSPSYPLDVKGKVGVGSDGTVYWGNAHDYGKLTWDTGKAIVRGESGKALSLGANATQDTIYINTSQNVGIGTTSPASGQKLTVSGDATVLGTMTCTTISKITGSFKIDHPLKPKTHSLVHSFVESPQADNTYSGKLRLVKGQAELNLDEYFGMTEGTIVALNRDFRVFTTNESNWDNVKGSVKNNILYIESNNPESMAEVSWLVIGERQDKEIHESELTNDEAKLY